MLKGRHFDSSAILLCVLRYAAYGVRAGHRLAHIGFSNFEGSRDGTGCRLLVKSVVTRNFSFSYDRGGFYSEVRIPLQTKGLHSEAE
jgi:hypothetical protein